MRIGVLTVSDSCAAEPAKDKSGPTLVEGLRSQFEDAVFKTGIVPDEIEKVESTLREWALELDVLLTSGGTGFSPRDLTPEATRRVIERPCPGIVVALIQEGLKHTPLAALSRPEAGIVGQCLVINLPGSPKACKESLTVLTPILHHAVALLRNDRPSEVGREHARLLANS